ncbi:ATP-binding protein [Adlercreutzia sp. ZJ242]|uniref:ATP-binding protein n=1 Tax=Adlercreutzia sp. ZJ242 TaxID=2709409 RepID=UPI0013EDF72A|nr:ATP-binding protein [Adlercreutzia sp. ZJ242]
MQEQDLSPIVERLRAQHTDDEFVEVKASAQHLSRDVWESVSAFANTAGGLILLGLDESNSFKPAKSFAIDKVLDQFVSGMGDGDPNGARVAQPPAYHLHRFAFEGSPVLAVEIEELEADKKPCYIVGRGLVGGSYKRVDDKDIRLSPTEIYSLTNFLKPSRADRQPVEAATGDDLSSRLVNDLLDREKDSRALRGAKTRDAKMARLGITSEKGDVCLAGLLVCGSYPQQFFPKLVVDVAVHPGAQKSDPAAPARFLDRVICEGPVGEVVEDAYRAIAKNLRTRSVVRGVGRVDELEIPEEVLREALVNAVVHREYGEYFIGQAVSVDIYPDRVEVTNPGGLWGGKTLENIGDGISACRNAALMKLMSLMPLPGGSGVSAEGNGSGIPLMKSAMASRALAEPRFVAGFDSFKVVLARGDAGIAEGGQGPSEIAYYVASHEPVRQPRWSRAEWRQRILAALDSDEPRGIREIAEALGRQPENTRGYVKALVEEGVVMATAPQTSKNRKYLLSPQPFAADHSKLSDQVE